MSFMSPMASTCFVRSLSSRTICASSRSIAWRCSGMFTTPAECRIKNEESNPFRANLGLFAPWRRDKHSAGMKVQEPSVIGDWRRRLKRLLCSSLAGAFLTGATATIAEPVAVAEKPAMPWTNGPWANSNFFPIAVWLQDPANAGRYRQAGINTYVGLWKGPTEDQLAALKKAGMWVVCRQNETGRRHRDDPTIIGWMHGDEPDNGQSWGAQVWFRLTHSAGKDRRRLPANEGRGFLAPDSPEPWPGRGLGRLVWPRQTQPSSRGLSRISQGLRHRVVRHLSGEPRQPRGARQFMVRRQRRGTAGPMGPGRKTGLELHRMHRHRQSEAQAHAATGPRRSLDVAHPRLARLDLLRPSIQTDVPRCRLAGRPGNARRRHPNQSANHPTGTGAEPSHHPRRRDRAIEKSGRAGGDDGQAIGRGDVSVCRGHARRRDRRNVHACRSERRQYIGSARRKPDPRGHERSFSDHFEPWAVHLYKLSPSSTTH